MNAISAPSRPIAVTSLMQQAGNMTVSDKADRVPAANGHETRNFAGVKQVQSSNDFLNHLLQSGSNSRKDNFVSISSSAVAVSTTNDIGTVQKAIMSVANPRGYSVVNASDVFAGAVFLQTPISKSEQINAVSSNVPQLMRPDDFLAAGLPASDFQSVETGSTTNFPSSSDLSQLKCAISQLISIDSDFVEELRRKICICSKFHNSGEFN
uniref:Uncharacterized protein n=1 Tax=Romanomermis culicivorax TaxID=13658 RepID=A0A915HSX1_ROMCU